MTELIKAKITKTKLEPCHHNTKIYPLIDPPPQLQHQAQVVFQSCQANEMHSLLKRHLVFHKEPDETLVNEALKYGLEQVHTLITSTGAITPMEYAETRKGQKRKRYIQAAEELDQLGLRPSAKKVQAFIKIEKWDKQVATKKSPRMIQYRHPTYVARVASHLYPIEHKIWGMERDGCRIFAKGLNTYDTAKQLRMKWDSCSSPIAIMKDFSKFDSCITKPWIKAEAAIYGLQGEFEEMEAQYYNRCTTKNGISYECEARKMSGEYNTSLGDSIINWLATTHAFFMVTGHRRVHLNINGDDDVMIVNEADIGDIEEFMSKFVHYLSEMGFKTEASYTRDFEKISFCQANPIEVEPELWRMVRTPERAISRDCYSVRKYGGKAWYRLCSSLGHCELALNDGVPIMQAWANYLLRAGRGTKVLNQEIDYKARVELKSKGAYRTTIHDRARLSFATAFDIQPTEQIAIEQWLNSQDKPIVLPTTRGYWG